LHVLLNLDYFEASFSTSYKILLLLRNLFIHFLILFFKFKNSIFCAKNNCEV